MQDATVDAERTPPLGLVPADQGEPDPGRDPVALAAADVRAIMAGASGLRRVVELAAETVLADE